MNKQSERDGFIAASAKAGLSVWHARLLLRHGASLQRYAEAQCNGDWPYDNGERKVVPCSRCEAGCVGYAQKIDRLAPPADPPKRICPECRIQDRVRAICKELPVTPDFQGDPRGYVLKLVTPDGREIGVPA